MKTYARKSQDRKHEPSQLDLDDSSRRTARRSKITDFFYSPVGAKEYPSCFEEAANTKTVGRASPKKDTEERRSVQTRLNLGQKGLVPTVCECGFLLDEEFPKDSVRHCRFHDQRWRVFQKASERFVKAANWTRRLTNGDEIIRMACRDLSPFQRQLVARIDEEMNAQAHHEEALNFLTIYLYIDSHKDEIRGFLSTEAVSQGLVSDGTPVNVMIGVSRIWVSPSSRRQGIATTLLQSIRRCHHASPLLCDEPCQMPPRLIAFSQPTAEGRKLAAAFLGRGSDQFILYR